MSLPRNGAFGRLVVPLGAGLLALALAASVWALVARELGNKRLYLEYEVYKAATALTDVVRLRRLEAADTADILGFGLYSAAGSPLYAYGSAPRALEPLRSTTPVSSFSVGEDSVSLIRALGGAMPGRRMPMWQGGAGRGGMGRPRFAPAPIPAPGIEPRGQDEPGPQGWAEPQAQALPALSYIEVSIEGLRAEERTLVAIAVASTVALAGLCALILAMNSRYAALKEREARNRELVELGEAARTIVHEIKNPLGVIRIQCGLLRRGADEAVAAGLSIIDDEAMRLAGLADRIRRFLKRDGRAASPVAVRPFLESFAARYEGRVASDLGAAPDGSALADESRLVEALDNLVANALEATERSAADREAGREPPVRLEAFERRGRLLVRVLDRGPGVAPGSERRIFEPFFTTKERGSGLGLALARRSAEAMGGSLYYEPRSGGGSSFTLELPLAKARPSRAAEPG